MHRSPLTAALAAGLALAAGCGPAVCKVTGTVRYKGKPVASGSVGLHPAGHAPLVVRLGPGGTFEVPAAPPGPARVTVFSPDPEWQVRADREMAAARGETPPPPPPAGYRDGWFAVPDKYRDPYRSDLTAELAAPATALDLDLK